MKLKPINLEEQIRAKQYKTISEHEILAQVKSILEADSKHEDNILETLNSGNTNRENNFNFELLDNENIFHISTIKTICVEYRLRFLDSNYFKPEFPQEAISKIKALEKQHNTTLKGFKIVAPAKLLKLENADDPLLFAPIGNGYYYLVHKWGNDLHPLRKLKMLPFKTYNNLLITALILSYTLSLVVPHGNITLHSSQFWIIFLFMFKSVIGIIIYYAFAKGKNVSAESWNSKYYNA